MYGTSNMYIFKINMCLLKSHFLTVRLAFVNFPTFVFFKSAPSCLGESRDRRNFRNVDFVHGPCINVYIYAVAQHWDEQGFRIPWGEGIQD